jgi:hypothetical protein
LPYQRGVFWGVVPYTPAAPFSVKFLRTYEDVATIGDLAREFRRQDVAGAVPFSVEGKLRPVLAISEPSPELGNVSALRLANISRRVRNRLLAPDEERAIRAGDHPYLLSLRDEVVRSLTRSGETYAVIVENPVTLHESAIATTAIGEITQDEFRLVCTRLVEVLQLDLGAGAFAPRFQR